MNDSQSPIDPESAPAPHRGGHERHCFIVMPFGRDAAEQKWFKGWYEVVIKPAVIDAGYEPKLAAAEEQPGAINDEIRSHLALDPMVVVDLGGVEPEDEPNANVMYELGIRHALGLPLVMMAWKGQRLPFDVSNQRIIMEDRDLVDLDINRKRLVTFIHAAQQGRYYKPMEAVGRIATIEAASQSLGEDSLLRALAQEVRNLRASLPSAVGGPAYRPKVEEASTVKKFILGKVFRKELFPYFESIGGSTADWAKILRTRIPPPDRESAKSWTADEWKTFISAKWQEIKTTPPTEQDFATWNQYGLDEQMIAAVKELLPPQPWPSGIHKVVAEKLGMSQREVTRYITTLIKRGTFVKQVNGQLVGADGAG